MLVSAWVALAASLVLPSALPNTRVQQRSAAVVLQERDLAETATAAVDSVMQMLSDDAEPPKSLFGVKEAVAAGEPLGIGAALYGLVVEQALDYDLKDGKMGPTAIDYSNLDDEKVREKMAYVYSYGISMFKRGYISEAALKDAVLNNVASRVGMSGPEFDKWLESAQPATSLWSAHTVHSSLSNMRRLTVPAWIVTVPAVQV